MDCCKLCNSVRCRSSRPGASANCRSKCRELGRAGALAGDLKRQVKLLRADYREIAEVLSEGRSRQVSLPPLWLGLICVWLKRGPLSEVPQRVPPARHGRSFKLLIEIVNLT